LLELMHWSVQQPVAVVMAAAPCMEAALATWASMASNVQMQAASPVILLQWLSTLRMQLRSDAARSAARTMACAQR
jgi:hypothetical protein